MKDKVELSIPKSKKVCGYEIKRMPIGRYLTTIKKLEGMPEEFFEKCFPNKNMEEILELLTKFDKDMINAVIYNLIYTIPEYAIDILAELTDISKEDLMNDENIGIDGFFEIIKAFEEVNQLGKSMRDAKAILSRVKASVPMRMASFGYKG